MTVMISDVYLRMVVQQFEYLKDAILQAVENYINSDEYTTDINVVGVPFTGLFGSTYYYYISIIDGQDEIKFNYKVWEGETDAEYDVYLSITDRTYSMHKRNG